MMSIVEKVECVVDAHGLVLDACDTIRNGNACDRCPLYCIEDSSWYEIADITSKEKILDFLKLADRVADHVSDEDYVANWADMARKEDDNWYD